MELNGRTRLRAPLIVSAALVVSSSIVRATPPPTTLAGDGSDTASAPRDEMTTYQPVLLDRAGGDAKELDEAEAAGAPALARPGRSVAGGPMSPARDERQGSHRNSSAGVAADEEAA